MAGRIQPPHKSNNRIVFQERLRGIAGIKGPRFAGFGMDIHDGQITLVRSGLDSRKNEFLAAWKVQQSTVLRGGSHEDEIVIPGIVQREKTAALHQDGMLQQVKDLVEFMHRENFAHARVVVQNEAARVADRIQIAHAGFRPSHECGIAKDYPRRSCARGELTPENTQGRRRGQFTPAFCPDGIKF